MHHRIQQGQAKAIGFDAQLCQLTPQRGISTRRGGASEMGSLLAWQAFAAYRRLWIQVKIEFKAGIRPPDLLQE
jgi:hypothetical protein